MPFHLPLSDMPLQEKLAAMETLWEALTRTPADIESPNWHKEILDNRQPRLAEGKSHFIDWEKAKGEIRSKLP